MTFRQNHYEWRVWTNKDEESRPILEAGAPVDAAEVIPLTTSYAGEPVLGITRYLVGLEDCLRL